MKHGLKPKQNYKNIIYKGVHCTYYFMNYFIGILTSFCLLNWNNSSSKHMLIGCVDIIEDDSNNFEESDFNSDVLKYCSTAIVLCGNY